MRKFIFVSIFFAMLESFLGTFSMSQHSSSFYETITVTDKDGKDDKDDKETGDDDVDDTDTEGSMSRGN